MRIFDICKKKNSHLVHRSCRGGPSFFCWPKRRKQEKDVFYEIKKKRVSLTENTEKFGVPPAQHFFS